MKRIISLVLALVTCLSVCFALGSCGGSKNPYQEYLKNHGSGKTYNVNEGTANPSLKDVEDNYYRAYEIDVETSGKFYVEARDGVIASRDNNENKQDYSISREMAVFYDMRDTVLKVNLYRYNFSTISYKGKPTDNYKWSDGFSYNPTRSSPVVLTFDIAKYFENGKLTVEDSLQTLSLDTKYIDDDKKGTDDKTYTERNPEWETKLVEDILFTVNDILSEIDKIVENQ